MTIINSTTDDVGDDVFIEELEIVIPEIKDEWVNKDFIDIESSEFGKKPNARHNGLEDLKNVTVVDSTTNKESSIHFPNTKGNKNNRKLSPLTPVNSNRVLKTNKKRPLNKGVNQNSTSRNDSKGLEVLKIRRLEDGSYKTVADTNLKRKSSL